MPFIFFSVHPYTYVDVYIYSHTIQLTIIVKYILLELTFLNDLASVKAEFQGVDDHAMVERAVDVFPHLKSTVAGLQYITTRYHIDILEWRSVIFNSVF